MKLPKEEARCNGLLPKRTNLAGRPATLWAFDCPLRERCRRFLAMDTDDPDAPMATYSYVAHHHAPGSECPDFLQETTDDTQ